MSEMKHRLLWTLVLMISVAMLLSACQTTAGTAGLGATVAAGFDGLLGVLRASGKIDDATQLSMSQSFHSVADNATKTAEGLQKVWDQLVQHKADSAARMVDVVNAAKDGISAVQAKIPSTGEIVGLSAVGGGGTGTALTQLIRGPRTPAHVKQIPAAAAAKLG